MVVKIECSSNDNDFPKQLLIDGMVFSTTSETPTYSSKGKEIKVYQKVNDTPKKAISIEDCSANLQRLHVKPSKDSMVINSFRFFGINWKRVDIDDGISIFTAR